MRESLRLAGRRVGCVVRSGCLHICKGTPEHDAAPRTGVAPVEQQNTPKNTRKQVFFVKKVEKFSEKHNFFAKMFGGLEKNT